MKYSGLVQLSLLLVAVSSIDACSRLLGRQFMSAVSRTAVRDVVANTAQQVVSQATSQVAAEVAKKSAIETVKGVVKAVAKKSVETAGQAVVFGAVDAAGDAVRASSQGDKVSTQLVTIQENQRALQLMQERQEQRKMQHQKEMKELQLKELEMSLPSKSKVVIEELSSENDDKLDNQIAKRKDLPVDGKRFDEDESVQEDLPQWAIFLAYIIGSFIAFLGFLMGYRCCKVSCKDSDVGNVYRRPRSVN